METVWVFGDQLNRRISSLEGHEPGSVRVLFIENQRRLRERRWHRQRLHLYLAGMRRFASELETAGFEVDYRKAKDFAAGLAAHRKAFEPERVLAMEPTTAGAADRLTALEVDLVANNQFLCSPQDFAAWASDRKQLRMEDFYRWQRQRLQILMEDDEPEGGRWNFDEENRKPPPEDHAWEAPPHFRLDQLDREVIAEVEPLGFGANPEGGWPTSRRRALRQLRHFVEHGLPGFGPYQDAMTERSWHLAHSLLSPALNLGLLHPREVCDAVESAYREGRVPIASAEGFIRQVIGWREYVFGVYRLWMPRYREMNELNARTKLLPCFERSNATQMRCVSTVVRGVEERGWSHHIERLMVLANLALLTDVRPQAFLAWMERAYVDATEWVMVPNVIGMGLHADGGRMASKPYASGGAYLNRMSDHCAECPYDPKKRTGEKACPFTALYWRFVDRHYERLRSNPRTSMAAAGLGKLKDREETLKNAERIKKQLVAGRI